MAVSHRKGKVILAKDNKPFTTAGRALSQDDRELFGLGDDDPISLSEEEMHALIDQAVVPQEGEEVEELTRKPIKRTRRQKKRSDKKEDDENNKKRRKERYVHDRRQRSKRKTRKPIRADKTRSDRLKVKAGGKEGRRRQRRSQDPRKRR